MVFHNEKVTSLEKIFDERHEIIDEDTLISTNLNLLYTALNYKYSKKMLFILKYYYELLELYTDVISKRDGKKHNL